MLHDDVNALRSRRGRRAARLLAGVIALAVAAVLPLAVAPEPAAAAPGLTIIVAPNGTAGAAGTLAAPTTLEGAQQKIRALASIPSGGVLVSLRGGVYARTAAFVLEPEDSGAPGSPIVWSAYAGEEPIISGATAVTGWAPLATTPAGITAAATGKLWVANITPGIRPHDLYVNGIAQQVARHSNTDEWRTWLRLTDVQPDPVPTGYDPDAGVVGAVTPCGPSAPMPNCGQRLTFPAGMLANLPNNGDLEIDLWPVEWWNTISVARGLNAGASTLWRHSLSPTTFWAGAFEYGRVNLMNALPFLDVPGEWVVDTAAGKLYYWPLSGSMTGASVVIPAATELWRLQGEESGGWADVVHDVEVRGLTFVHTDRVPEDQWPAEWLKRNAEYPGAAVTFRGVEDVVFADNLVRDVAGYGLFLDLFAQRVTVTGNEIAHTGSGGIQIHGYGPGTLDVNRDHVVERNYIHDVGLDYAHSPAIAVWASNGNVFRYNYLENLSYAGIFFAGAQFTELLAERSGNHSTHGMDSYGDGEAMYRVRTAEIPSSLTYAQGKDYLHSGDNLVEKNVVLEYLLRAGDGGALYTWAAGNNSVWRENLAYKSTDMNNHMPLYLDNHSDYTTVEDNIVWAPANVTVEDRSYYLKEAVPRAPTTNVISGNVRSHPAKPAGWDALLATILGEAEAAGGYRGLDTTASPVAPGAVIQGEAVGAQVGTYTASGGSGSFLAGLDGGEWVRYDAVDFGDGGLQTLTASLSVDPTVAGKVIQIRIDSRTSGPMIGALTTTSTGGWSTFTTQSTPIAQVRGVHDVYLVAASPGFGVAGIDWLSFRTDATQPIQSERWAGQSGTVTAAAGSGTVVNGLDGADWLRYASIDFGSTPLTAFQVNMAVPASHAGKQIAIRLDGPTGTTIGTLTTTSTGGWTTYATRATAIAPTTGVHDVYLVPLSGSTGYGGLDWMRFIDGSTTRTQAESFAATTGTYLGAGGVVVDGLDHGEWLQYSVDFGSQPATLMQFRLAVDAAAAPKTIEIRLGSTTGTVIGTLTTASTGGWTTFGIQSAVIAPTTGVQNVFLVAATPGAGYASLDWFAVM